VLHPLEYKSNEFKVEKHDEDDAYAIPGKDIDVQIRRESAVYDTRSTWSRKISTGTFQQYRSCGQLLTLPHRITCDMINALKWTRTRR
jgi:hypothetical protein